MDKCRTIYRITSCFMVAPRYNFQSNFMPPLTTFDYIGVVLVFAALITSSMVAMILKILFIHKELDYSSINACLEIASDCLITYLVFTMCMIRLRSHRSLAIILRRNLQSKETNLSWTIIIIGLQYLISLTFIMYAWIASIGLEIYFYFLPNLIIQFYGFLISMMIAVMTNTISDGFLHVLNQLHVSTMNNYLSQLRNCRKFYRYCLKQTDVFNRLFGILLASIFTFSVLQVLNGLVFAGKSVKWEVKLSDILYGLSSLVSLTIFLSDFIRYWNKYTTSPVI